MGEGGSISPNLPLLVYTTLAYVLCRTQELFDEQKKKKSLFFSRFHRDEVGA